jgi:hypothetical protein
MKFAMMIVNGNDFALFVLSTVIMVDRGDANIATHTNIPTNPRFETAPFSSSLLRVSHTTMVSAIPTTTKLVKVRQRLFSYFQNILQ